MNLAPVIVSAHYAPGCNRTFINIAEPIDDVRAPNGGQPSLQALAHMVTYEADAIARALHEALPSSTCQKVLHRLSELTGTNPTLGGRS